MNETAQSGEQPNLVACRAFTPHQQDLSGTLFTGKTCRRVLCHFCSKQPSLLLCSTWNPWDVRHKFGCPTTLTVIARRRETWRERHGPAASRAVIFAVNAVAGHGRVEKKLKRKLCWVCGFFPQRSTFNFNFAAGCHLADPGFCHAGHFGFLSRCDGVNRQ